MIVTVLQLGDFERLSLDYNLLNQLRVLGKDVRDGPLACNAPVRAEGEDEIRDGASESDIVRLRIPGVSKHKVPQSKCSPRG